MNDNISIRTINGATGSFILNIIMIVLFIVVSMTYSSNPIETIEPNIPKSKTSSQVNKETTLPGDWYEIDRREINFNKEYGEVIYLPKYKGYSFENATQPYCIKNKANIEACGVKGEDIGNKLGNSTDNSELQLKSTNGLNGHIRIVIWEKKN